MTKRMWLKIVNIILLAAFLLVLISMSLYRFIPSPLQGMEIFLEIHEISGPAFALIAIVHLILNWGWIKTQYLKKKPGEKS